MSAPIFTLASVAELEARLEAERTGLPFVMLRDDSSHQRIVTLDSEEVVIGREVDRGIRGLIGTVKYPGFTPSSAGLATPGRSSTMVCHGMGPTSMASEWSGVGDSLRANVIRCGEVDIAFATRRRHKVKRR